MATKKSPAKKAAPAKKTAKKAAKLNVEEPEVQTVTSEAKASESGLLPKIQCFGAKKKIICSHLLLSNRKCTAKMIANGRRATVNISKKRRCSFYEETTYTA